MEQSNYIRPAKGGCLLLVDVSPGASESSIVGVNQWRGTLQVRVAAQAQEGEANEELVRFIASKLRTPSSSISIVKGSHSSRKTLLIGLDQKKVREMLGVH